MHLKLDEQENGIFKISVHGRVSQTAVEDCATQLPQLIGPDNLGSKILLSLHGAEQIDSSGIGWLLSMDKQVRQAGGELIIHSVPLEIQHVFNLMKLGKVLKIAKDARAATQMIQTGETHG
ncbi:MAG: anti-sigma factor antagonist [Planctomycetota bacterium]|nr:MAG: anti-sigma factor antagonist [Planctomycetota bacterium]